MSSYSSTESLSTSDYFFYERLLFEQLYLLFLFDILRPLNVLDLNKDCESMSDSSSSSTWPFNDNESKESDDESESESENSDFDPI